MCLWSSPKSVCVAKWTMLGSQVFHSKSLYTIVLMVLPDWPVINLGKDTFYSYASLCF